MTEKYYQLATYTEQQWDELNSELTGVTDNCDCVPDRSVVCADQQLHSATRGTYLLTDEEAEKLKSDPRVKFINVDYKSYPEIYKPPPEELQATSPSLLDRWSAPVSNIRRIPNPLPSTVNRTGYQLLRCQQELDPWVGVYADTAVVSSNISYYGTGKNVDVIVADDATWFGHPEFQNNPVLASDGTTPVELPNEYVGGNVLPGNGTCDLLDLVLDAPYYIDPDWFNADPGSRLTTRWDGTVVPVESVARAWWSNSTQRSSQFASAGTVSVTSSYTRAYNNGSNTALSTVGNHGTACAALTYGRTQGWAYNANKWAFNLYNTNGSDIEQGFDIVKIFHQTKPVNPLYGSKDPTVMSNSWGYRSVKNPSGAATWYYNHRTSTNVAYTTNTGINWLSHMGTQGDANRWKSEMKTNSYTQALDELISSGVIFVAAAGNSNQKQVSSDHPDFNNYITRLNGGALGEEGVIDTGFTGACSSSALLTGGSFNPSPGNAFSIVTSSGVATITAITNSFQAITTNAVTTPTSGTNDDGFYTVNIPWNIDYNGTTYSQVFVGTNTYLTFGSGSTVFSGIGPSSPAVNKICVSSADNSGQRIYTDTQGTAPNRTFIIRFQGTAATSGTLGSPNMEWEWHFNENVTNEIQLHVNVNSRFGPSDFLEFGLAVNGSTNRRGFPQQGGMYEESGQRIYPVINIGALDDNFNDSKETKVGYSDRGNEIDVYAPADGTLAANRGYPSVGTRLDSYPGLTVANPSDASFSGTSAACPVAAGLIATMMEYNRNWGWQEVRSWLQGLNLQDSGRFYYGVESTDPFTSNWLDYRGLEGGVSRVIYQTALSTSTIRARGSLRFQNGLTLRFVP